MHLQPFITDRLVLRGRYQTVPIAVYGYALSAVAAGAEEPSVPTISIAHALRRLPAGGGLKWRGGSLEDAAGSGPPFHELPPHAAHALQQLVSYWRSVGVSERLMAQNPPPAAALAAALAAANFMCDTLLCATQAHPEAPAALTAAQQQQQPGMNGGGSSTGGSGTVPAAMPDWAADATDMAAGWCSLLGYGAVGRTAHAVECGAAGLAAAVLLCSTPATAAQFLGRHGALLLADILTMPHAPAHFTRHALAACLLCVLSCGALGCEAVLGWWKPDSRLDAIFKVWWRDRS